MTIHADPQTHSRFPDGKPRETQPKWRRDFPIDVPEDTYVARRDFVKFLVLTSAAFVFGQLFIAAHSVIQRLRPKPGHARVAAIDAIPVGGAMMFEYPDKHDSCLLLRTAENEFVAYNQKCTHLSCAVTPDFGSGRLLCPCHHGYFDLATGRPLAGPPRRPLPKITLEIRNGEIFATGVELRT